MSNTASVEVVGGAVAGNVGGLWIWQSGRATCTGVQLEGGSAHVILADQGGMPTMQVRPWLLHADTTDTSSVNVLARADIGRI